MFDTHVEDIPVGGVRHTLVGEYRELRGFGRETVIRELGIFAPNDIAEHEAALYAERGVGNSIWMLIDVEYNATEV